MSVMKTRVTELLGMEKPIIQGGMAWVAESHLAAAVSEAGGFGLIGAANAPADVVRNYIREAKKLTDRPFGVNIMLLSPFADDIAKVVVQQFRNSCLHNRHPLSFFTSSSLLFLTLRFPWTSDSLPLRPPS